MTACLRESELTSPDNTTAGDGTVKSKRPYVTVQRGRSSGAALVAMMSPNTSGIAMIRPRTRRLNGAWLRRILVQTQMCAAPMIVVYETSQVR